MTTTHNPIHAIQKLSIPTNSFIAAAFAAGEFRFKCDLVNYNNMISTILGRKADYLELPIAQMVFGYLVQEHVRNFSGSNALSASDVEILATQRAQKFVKEQPWHWAEGATETALERMSNREEAIRIMQALPSGTDRKAIVLLIVEKLEVSEATALSYIRSAVKDDNVEVTVTQAPKINKKAAALELVKNNPTLDKKTLIAMISKTFDTTPAGAQTYYYAAIKQLNISPTSTTKRVNTRAQVATIFEANPNISRIEFIEQAEIQFDVQINTAQTYYYALVAERKAKLNNVDSK